jgi:hypothetical protein
MVDNLIMPDDISIGFKGGPRFYTDKSVASNRQKRRMPNTTIAEHAYTWSLHRCAGMDGRSAALVLL